MMYISDISRIKDSLVGVTNTENNTFEYLSISDVTNDIIGYNNGDIFSVIPYTDTEVVYLGDYILPPITQITGRLYLLKGYEYYHKRRKVAIYYYPIFYMLNGVEYYSITRLVITKGLVDASIGGDSSVFPTEVKYNEQGIAVNYTKMIDTNIQGYFLNNPVVDVTLKVLTNKDKLSELLGTSVNNTITLRVLNAGVTNSGCVRPLIHTDITSNLFIDVTAPPSISKSVICEYNLYNRVAEAYISRANCSKYMRNYWLDFAKAIDEDKVSKSLENPVLEYSQSGICLNLNRPYVFGVKADKYNLDCFVSKMTRVTEQNFDSYWGMLQEYYPNKTAYIKERINSFNIKGRYTVYTTVQGIYIVREKAIDIVKKCNVTQFDNVKCKLKLVSDCIRIDKVTNNILYITLIANSNGNYYDLASILKGITFKSVIKIILKFSDTPLHPFKITIPKGIVSIEGYPNSNISIPKNIYSNSEIYLRTTSKTELKSLVNNRFLQSLSAHIYAEESMTGYMIETLLVSECKTGYVEHTVQTIFDYYTYTAKLSEDKQKEIVTKIKSKIDVCLRECECSLQAYTNRVVQISTRVLGNLEKAGLISRGKIYHNLLQSGMRVTTGTDLINTGYAYMELISNLIDYEYNITPVIKNIFQEYLRFADILEKCYAHLITGHKSVKLADMISFKNSDVKI